RTLLWVVSPESRATCVTVRCVFPSTFRLLRSKTGELLTHAPAPRTIAIPSTRTSHRRPRLLGLGMTSESTAGAGTPLPGCHVEIADTLHLRFELDSTSVSYERRYAFDQAIDVGGGGSRPRHDEVGVFLRDHRSPHGHALRAGCLDQPRCVVL